MKSVLPWLVCAVQSLTISAAPVQLKLTGAKVDGQALSLAGAIKAPAAGMSELQLPYRCKQLEVSISVVTPRTEERQYYRLRYKLDGWDKEWKDPNPGYMFVAIQVVDEQFKPFAEERLEYRGDSPGWRGQVDGSEFTPYRLEFKMPPGAVRTRVTAYSSGGRSAMGILALQNFKMSIGKPGDPSFREARFPLEVSKDGAEPRTVASLRNSLFPGRTLLDIPPQWDRAYLDTNLARLVRVKKPSPRNVLILEDQMLERTGLWRIADQYCLPVAPGETVVAEWEACYALGRSAPATVTYNRLPSGRYWLRVAPFALDGSRVGEEISVPIRVLPPVWGRLWFWLVLGSLGTVAAVWWVRRVTRQRMQRALELAEHQRAMEQERTRIARDLHDNLGTTLTRVFMLSETARKHPEDAARTATELQGISTAVQEATHAMQEIVWAANPANDSPDELATYLSGTAQRVLDDVGVACRLDMPADLPSGTLSADVRHNIFLAFREALNNAVRHGHPSEVRVSLRLNDGTLEVQVEDNGCGFTAPAAPGHGLDGMRLRMEKIGGRFSVKSEPGRGTRVQLAVPFKVAEKTPGTPPV